MPEKQIDFYTSVDNLELFACRLAQKVYANSQSLLVLLSDDAALKSFSRCLWSISDTSFIPHCQFDSKEAIETTIWLATEIPECACQSVLINLTTKYASNLPSSFMRILEIVGNDEESLSKARERFCFYRDMDFKITHHNMGKR